MAKEISELDKTLGAFYGVAIGDALGMPVETWSAEQIKQAFGQITDYKDPGNHRWFQGFKPGVTTDDWQLTEALAQSILECHGIDMEDIAKKFVKSFSRRNIGWGKSTQTAAMKILLGDSWISSGKTDSPNAGSGNGVAMKIAPLALMAFLEGVSLKTRDEKLYKYFRRAYDIASMTHNTVLGISSAYTQFAATLFCLEHDASKINSIERFCNDFLDTISYWCLQAEKNLPRESSTNPDEVLSYKLKQLKVMFYEDKFDVQNMIASFGAGSCFIPHSLPFTYGFFLSGPRNINSLYGVINAGGDTDTNGSMLGALLGALNGFEIFPKHLVGGLFNRATVENLANNFFKTFFQK